jgi:hypothetical protein
VISRAYPPSLILRAGWSGRTEAYPPVTMKPRKKLPAPPTPLGRRFHLAIDLGFRKALEMRAELAAQGLADPNAPISLEPSSGLDDYPEEELPKQ